MPIATENNPREVPPALATSNEPKVTKRGKNGAPVSVGAQALNDAIILIVICWAILFFLAWSLRAHNI